MITNFKLFEKEEHLKTYEDIHNASNYSSIKKGDSVVFVDNKHIGTRKFSKLNKGEKYIVENVYDKWFNIIDNTNKNDAYFLTVIDMNGNIILRDDIIFKEDKSKPMLIYAYRFMPELEYITQKYNL